MLELIRTTYKPLKLEINDRFGFITLEIANTVKSRKTKKPLLGYDFFRRIHSASTFWKILTNNKANCKEYSKLFLLSSCVCAVDLGSANVFGKSCGS